MKIKCEFKYQHLQIFGLKLIMLTNMKMWVTIVYNNSPTDVCEYEPVSYIYIDKSPKEVCEYETSCRLIIALQKCMKMRLCPVYW